MTEFIPVRVQKETWRVFAFTGDNKEEFAEEMSSRGITYELTSCAPNAAAFQLYYKNAPKGEVEQPRLYMYLDFYEKTKDPYEHMIFKGNELITHFKTPGLNKHYDVLPGGFVQPTTMKNLQGYLYIAGKHNQLKEALEANGVEPVTMVQYTYGVQYSYMVNKVSSQVFYVDHTKAKTQVLLFDEKLKHRKHLTLDEFKQEYETYL